MKFSPSILGRVAAASLFAVAALSAQADVYEFNLSGSTYSADWLINSQPEVETNVSTEGAGFLTVADSGYFPDSPDSLPFLTFYKIRPGSNFVMGITDLATIAHLYVSSEQLYTGSELSPTFKLGVFQLQDHLDASVKATLTITNISAVPEPASLAMLLAGLGSVGAVVARRRKA